MEKEKHKNKFDKRRSILLDKYVKDAELFICKNCTSILSTNIYTCLFLMIFKVCLF